MVQMQPTHEDVVKSLECCTSLKYTKHCENCFFKCERDCTTVLMSAALNMTNEMQKEITELNKKKCIHSENEFCKVDVVTEQNEALNETLDHTIFKHNKTLDELIDWCKWKLKREMADPFGLYGRKLDGYEIAMKAVMSYLHSKKEK